MKPHLIAATLLAATSLCALVGNAFADVPPPPPPAAERMRRANVAFEPIKLAIEPETLQDIGARSFEAYRTKHQHIVILVFHFSGTKAAREAPDKVTRWATRPPVSLLHYPRVAVRRFDLLLLGTSTEKPLAPETRRTMVRLEAAFEG